MKSKRREKPLLFVVPGLLLILSGFGIMIAYSLGDRIGAAASSSLSFAAAHVAVGAMLLTRTLLVTFRFMDLRHAHLFWKAAVVLLSGGTLTAIGLIAVG